LERIRRSIAMLPPGYPAGALTMKAAMELVREAVASGQDAERYQAAVAKLPAVIDAVDDPT
jgi:hypothetical protein